MAELFSGASAVPFSGKHRISHSPAVRIILAGAGGCVLALVAAALWMQVDSLPAGASLWARMPVDTAAALILHALGLILCGFGGFALPVIIAAVVALLSAANLASALSPLSMSLGGLMQGNVPLPGILLEPMAPIMALGLLLAAGQIPQLTRKRNGLRISFLGVGSTVVLSIALILLTGKLTGLGQVEDWFGFEHSGVLAVFALTVVGAIGLFSAISSSRRTGYMQLPWAPVALGFGAMLWIGFLYIALVGTQMDFVTRQVNSDANVIAREIGERFENKVQGLVHGVRRLERANVAAVGPEEITEVSRALFLRGYRGHGWLDANLQLRMAILGEDNGHQIQRELILEGTAPSQFERAIRLRTYVASDPIPFGEEETGFYLFFPSFRDETLQGFLVVAYVVEETIAPSIAGIVERGTIVQILDRGSVITQVEPAAFGVGNEDHQFMAMVDDVGPGWTVSLIPTDQLISRYRNELPETVLLLGTLLGLLAVFLMHTRQRLTGSHRQVKKLNEQLERKVRERTDALLKEVSQREQFAANLAHAAKHDALTGLPNRDLFAEHLAHAMSNARRQSGVLATMFVDLDSFKDVNDSLGHAIGDDMLQQVARRMRDSLREADVVARQGGDEFLVLAEALRHPDDAEELATKIINALGREFAIGEHRVHVSASIGIALSGGGGGPEDAATVIRNADAAMYQAKSEGKNRFAFHSQALQARIQERLDIKAALIQALEQKQLEVYYQPRLDIKTRQALGAEALVRWNRPGHGYLSPAVFIPIAEDTGLVTAVGKQVLYQVCDELNRWVQEDGQVPAISVNTSVHQFRDGQLLCDIQNCVDAHPQVARYLELELTERVLIDNREEYLVLLQDLSAMGIRIAIDDFGTGCASFGYFRNFPIHVVKIDQSFIEHMVDNDHDAMITHSIIDLARNFRLQVVAEGVETEDQYRLLKDAGCHEAQGYLLGKPMSAKDFRAYWKQQQREVV